MTEQERITALREAITRQAADDKMLIHLGMVTYLEILTNRHPDLPNNQAAVEFIKEAFFSGAEYLYFTIMGIFDPGNEPTKADERRMEHVHHELLAFQNKLREKYGDPKSIADAIRKREKEEEGH